MVTLALTGDIGEEIEKQLVEASAIPKLDILKLPHHGSRSSSSEALLNAASPTFGVISVGPFNRHGMPHKTVVRRFLDRGVRLFRTDTLGAVRMVTDGRRIEIGPAVLR